MSGKAEILKMIEGRIETIEKLTQECIELLYKGAYNEAIEDAANIMDNDTDRNNVRSLKKE